MNLLRHRVVTPGCPDLCKMHTSATFAASHLVRLAITGSCFRYRIRRTPAPNQGKGGASSSGNGDEPITVLVLHLLTWINRMAVFLSGEVNHGWGSDIHPVLKVAYCTENRRKDAKKSSLRCRDLELPCDDFDALCHELDTVASSFPQSLSSTFPQTGDTAMRFSALPMVLTFLPTTFNAPRSEPLAVTIGCPVDLPLKC